jgi:exopolysaccharide production protein ExoY
VTGLAQTSGRGHLSFRETVDLDVDYVKARSFSLNIAIIYRTVKMVILGHGAF